MQPFVYTPAVDKTLLGSCFLEIAKLAALEPGEEPLLKRLLQQQAAFDQLASSGEMSEEQQAAHRANTERLKLFLGKKRGSGKIPSWARDLNAEMPGGAGPGVPRSKAEQVASEVLTKHPYLSGAGAGAVYGGLVGGIGSSVRKLVLSPKEEKKRVREAEEKGPIAGFTARNPITAGAAYGSLSLPAMMYGESKAGFPGFMLGSMAPGLAATAFDKGYTALKKRREEFASKATSPKVSKPKAA